VTERTEDFLQLEVKHAKNSNQDTIRSFQVDSRGRKLQWKIIVDSDTVSIAQDGSEMSNANSTFCKLSFDTKWRLDNQSSAVENSLWREFEVKSLENQSYELFEGDYLMANDQLIHLNQKSDWRFTNLVM